jgi:hypothetical protein
MSVIGSSRHGCGSRTHQFGSDFDCLLRQLTSLCRKQLFGMLNGRYTDMIRVRAYYTTRLCSRTILATLAGIVLASSTIRAAVSYEDVAVVVNTRSSASVAIGDYYRYARSIPSANMIYVSTDTVEEIDSTTFELLRSKAISLRTT